MKIGSELIAKVISQASAGLLKNKKNPDQMPSTI